MKKIFAFAMALVSMAAVMTSCSNDETDFIQQRNPNPIYNNSDSNNGNKQTEVEDQTEQVVEFLLPVTDAQLEIMDITITYSIRGHITEITPEEMTEVQFPARMTDNGAIGNAKLLKFRVPGTYTMTELRGATMERTAKLKEEGVAKYLGQKVNLFFGYTCTVEKAGKEAYFDVANFKYAPNTNMSEARIFDKAITSYQRMGGKTTITVTL